MNAMYPDYINTLYINYYIVHFNQIFSNQGVPHIECSIVKTTFVLVKEYFRDIFESLTLKMEKCTCLLYTSDAADDMQCVDLGGRRIIKKALVSGWC